MNSPRVELFDWGCVVAIIDERLHAASLRTGPDIRDEPLAPVDFVCRHFLADVNHALGSDFVTDEFDIVACEGCELPDDQPEPQAASFP
jgi:hypothetical protein